MEIKTSSEKRFALLIDADNVSAKYIKPINDELSKYGTVTIKRIYGDWTLSLHAKWKDALLENSITPIQQFGYTQGKNATDSAMIIDAMDILYGGSVDGFCIVSSDSDFTRLASRIRESGLTVIGMGEKKTPIPFRRACDIFTVLELLVADSNGRHEKTRTRNVTAAPSQAHNSGPTIEQVERAIITIITDNTNNGKSTGLGEVGSRLLKRYPDFDVRSYGTSLLSKLLEKFDSVDIIKDGSSVAVVLAESPEAEEASGESGEEKQVNPEGDTRKPLRAEDAQGKQSADKGGTVKRSLRRRHEKGKPSLKTAEQTPDKRAEAPQKADKDVKSLPSADRAQLESRTQKQKRTADKKKPATPDAYIRQLLQERPDEGINLSDLGKHVRARFRDFKVRDLGFTQLRTYVASLPEVEVVKDGKAYVARLQK